MKHLTVAIDGTAASEAASRYANELARTGAAVSFCSIADGGRADAVIACGRENASAAIITGTRARRGGSRSLGSVTEAVMHVADRPVIVVHEDDDPRDGPIAVALSGYDASHVVLDTAISLAAALGRELFLMTDIVLPEYVASYAIEANAATRMTEAAKRAHAAGIKASIAVGDGVGAIADTLISAAERRGCSMIVTGFHQHSGLVRMFIGSVAEQIVREASVPVAVVRLAREPAR
jgi:nucleotide-binding universal stress UspA family protein